MPLFFTISSYLLFEKTNKNNLFSKENINIYKKYILRLLKLYIGWTFIHFIFFNFILNLDISFTFYFVTTIFVGFYIQFWFLHAQILGTISFLFLLKKFNLRKTLFISLLLYILGLALVTYNPIVINFLKFIPVYNDSVLLCRNFLTFALIFISIGAYFSIYKDKIKKISTNKLIKYIICFSFASILEFIFLKKINSPYFALQIFILILTIFIFKLLLKINLKKKSIYMRLRNYSTIIYCLHNLIYILLKRIITIQNSLLMYILTVITCIIISEIIIFIDKKVINIKFLY